MRGKDTVLMLDARNVYRKVTRKIYDFSPEQQQNLQAIVWLYRGETDRYLQLVSQYLGNVVDEATACFEVEDDLGQTFRPLPDFGDALNALRQTLALFLKTQSQTDPQAEVTAELEKETRQFAKDIEQFRKSANKAVEDWEKSAGSGFSRKPRRGEAQGSAEQSAPDTNAALVKLTTAFEPVAEASRDLIKQTDLIYKLATRLIDELTAATSSPDGAKRNPGSNSRDLTRARKAADEARGIAVEQLKKVRYFWKQAHWLTDRFPQGQLRDVEGLVKLVDIKEIEANDWSLTPGRYVGVAPEEEDEGFDFEETLREIHVELEDLNAEAVKLAATIKKNFEELGI